MIQDDPYADPDLYDLEYADYDEDLAYYRQLAEGRSPVLELACGTGRLTLAMARAGAEVHAFDLSDSMLDGLARKLDEDASLRKQVQWWRGDFRDFDAPASSYPLVLLPFNALHHCRTIDDVRRTLTCIDRHTAPGGLIGIDVYLKDLDLYDRDPNKRYEPRIFRDPRTGKMMHSWEQGWWDDATQTHHVVYTYKHTDGTEERAHLQLSMYDRPVLEALFEELGWQLVGQWQDFKRTALTPKSLKWVVQLRKPA